jgi:hypothetical protein
MLLEVFDGAIPGERSVSPTGGAVHCVQRFVFSKIILTANLDESSANELSLPIER